MRTKAAPTLAAVLIGTVHVPVPLHAPLQPAKAEPAAGVAESVTGTSIGISALHVVPQVIPAAEVNPPLGVKSNDWIDGWKK